MQLKVKKESIKFPLFEIHFQKMILKLP